MASENNKEVATNSTASPSANANANAVVTVEDKNLSKAQLTSKTDSCDEKKTCDGNNVPSSNNTRIKRRVTDLHQEESVISSSSTDTKTEASQDEENEIVYCYCNGCTIRAANVGLVRDHESKYFGLEIYKCGNPDPKKRCKCIYYSYQYKIDVTAACKCKRKDKHQHRALFIVSKTEKTKGQIFKTCRCCKIFESVSKEEYEILLAKFNAGNKNVISEEETKMKSKDFESKNETSNSVKDSVNTDTTTCKTATDNVVDRNVAAIAAK